MTSSVLKSAVFLTPVDLMVVSGIFLEPAQNIAL